MKRLWILPVLCTPLVTAAYALQARGPHRPVQRVLAMNTLYGVDGALVGPSNPIRDIPGDELPWVVGNSTHGQLDSNGRLRIHVHGLVFADDPSVPPELRGTNDETQFRAVLSCLTVDSSGALVTSNLTTAGFPATTSGDAEIDTTLQLPSPCVAPVVFVIAGSEFKWFAVTGVETEGD